MTEIPEVHVFTVDQLRRMRSDLVHSLPDHDEMKFRQRAHGYTLTADEQALYDELNRLDYLLGDDR